MNLLTDWNHLTWNGRASLVWYRIRRVFVSPAPPGERCVMGAPVDPAVHCPRWSIEDDMWCDRHRLASKDDEVNARD